MAPLVWSPLFATSWGRTPKKALGWFIPLSFRTKKWWFMFFLHVTCHDVLKPFFPHSSPLPSLWEWPPRGRTNVLSQCLYLRVFAAVTFSFLSEATETTQASFACLHASCRVFFLWAFVYYHYHIPDVVLSKTIPNKEKKSNTWWMVPKKDENPGHTMWW